MKFLLVTLLALAGAAWLAIRMADMAPGLAEKNAATDRSQQSQQALEKIQRAQQQLQQRPQQLQQQLSD